MKLGMGIGLLALFIGLSLSAELSWIPGLYNPLESDFSLSSFPSAPSWSHPFGTDDRGRDVLSRLIFGIKFSFLFSALVWFFSYSLGIILGALMGYCGGLLDLIGQRIVEIFETVPYLFVVMLVVSGLGRSLFILVLVNVLLGWMMISSYIRSQVLREKQSLNIEAVRALGASPWRVVFFHVLPASIFPALIFSPLALASYTATLVQLDYLGVGFQPPTPSWGEVLSQANKYFPEAWWLLVFPLLFIVWILAAFQLIASGTAFGAKSSRVSAKI